MSVDDVISMRRLFHRHAERGWEEFWTTAFVASRLEPLGFRLFLGSEAVDERSAMGRPDGEALARARTRARAWGADAALIDRIGDWTGVVALLDTGRPGPVTAFRFDLDAVETPECRERGHRPFDEGFDALDEKVAHACGHDGHLAMGLALASRLVSRKESLSGRFKLLFQPAEEGVRGGRAMTEKGHLDDVDFLFGLHLAGEFASGIVGAGCSDFLCTTKVDAFFRGVAAHAGMAPNEGRNALLAAATAVLGLHSIAPHREGASRINVGLLRAGTGRNVVPERAELFFETRGRTSAVDRYVYERALEVLDGAARTQGVTVESRLAGGAVDARSHPDLVALVAEKALAVDGIDHVEREGRIGGSEDISWMMHRVEERGGKACYFIVGADRTAGHHHGRFDFDEAVLPRGVALLAALAEAVGGDRK